MEPVRGAAGITVSCSCLLASVSNSSGYSCSLPQGWPSLTSLLSRSTPKSSALPAAEWSPVSARAVGGRLRCGGGGGCLLVPKDSFPEKPAHGQD